MFLSRTQLNRILYGDYDTGTRGCDLRVPHSAITWSRSFRRSLIKWVASTRVRLDLDLAMEQELEIYQELATQGAVCASVRAGLEQAGTAQVLGQGLVRIALELNALAR